MKHMIKDVKDTVDYILFEGKTPHGEGSDVGLLHSAATYHVWVKEQKSKSLT